MRISRRILATLLTISAFQWSSVNVIPAYSGLKVGENASDEQVVGLSSYETDESERNSDPTVVIGGTSGFDSLANPDSSMLLRRTGKIGLYLHYSATDPRYFGDTLPRISQIFGESSAQVVELSLGGGFNTSFFASTAWTQNVTANGFKPSGSVINIDTSSNAFSRRFSPSDLHNFEAFVNEGKKRTYLKWFAPVVTPNSSGGAGAEGDMNTIVIRHPWEDVWWDDVRAAAVYGGGISIDSPPAFFFSGFPNSVQQSAYQLFVIKAILWAEAYKLRCVFLVSPYFDEGNFPMNVEKLYNRLLEANALPTTWAVINYNECGSPYQRRCERGKDPAYGNPVGSDVSAPGEASIALWLILNGRTRRH